MVFQRHLESLPLRGSGQDARVDHHLIAVKWRSDGHRTHRLGCGDLRCAPRGDRRNPLICLPSESLAVGHIPPAPGCSVGPRAKGRASRTYPTRLWSVTERKVWYVVAEQVGHRRRRRCAHHRVALSSTSTRPPRDDETSPPRAKSPSLQAPMCCFLPAARSTILRTTSDYGDRVSPTRPCGDAAGPAYAKRHFQV